MRALTVVPGIAGSGELSDVAEPDEREGPVLVSTMGIGICGTDREILSGAYGDERLVLGHESLGRVVEAPQDGDLSPGDLVVGIVRRPDPVPCLNCAAGEWDMCRNGRHSEHGIKAPHGFARERFRAYPDSLVTLDPVLGKRGVLLEPTSVVAKAWERIERIGPRAVWEPARVLITGQDRWVCSLPCWPSSARPGGARARPGNSGPQARSCGSPWGAVSLAAGGGLETRGGRRHRVHGGPDK